MRFHQTYEEEGVIRFPDEDPEVLYMYLSFAYDANGVENYTGRIIDGDVLTNRTFFH
jgi:hypothetical protein